MIHENKCYSISCDNCSEDFENLYTGFSIWIDENLALESASDNGWYVDDNHYCPKCHHIDDDDNLVVYPKKTDNG